MTVNEVIDGFREGVEENAERDAYASELFQEAVRIGMELNNQYHTPEELREIMGRLTGKKIDDTFRLFPPFYTDFGKNITIGKDVFINSGCHFQDQGGIEIGDGASGCSDNDGSWRCPCESAESGSGRKGGTV